jgi:TRAP-type mannitol/chloroaromatic compound transport system permease large subunit
MDQTMRLTAMVIFILIGARVFSLVFQGVDGGRLWIEHADQPARRRVGFLIFVNIFIFFLAFFLDFFEIAFIIVPCWHRSRLRSASTWSGSACCSA